MISIHAPARGATTTRRSARPVTPHFNPRSREGSDMQRRSCCVFSGYFNPRSREGSDCESRDNTILFQDFNPRSREGSDLKVIGLISIFKISIHAPARGATNRTESTLTGSSFQSTLPRGERRLSSGIGYFAMYISIHAPARGATL